LIMTELLINFNTTIPVYSLVMVFALAIVSIIKLFWSHGEVKKRIEGIEKEISNNAKRDEATKAELYNEVKRVERNHYSEIKRIDENYGRFRENFGKLEGMLQMLIDQNNNSYHNPQNRYKQ